MEGRHTATCIRDEFEVMTNEFGISNKTIVCVTDNAANMKKAVRKIVTQQIMTKH